MKQHPFLVTALTVAGMVFTTSSTTAASRTWDTTSGDGATITAVTGKLTLDLGNSAILTLSELGTGSWSVGDKLTRISYSGTWHGSLFNLGSTLADDSTITFSGIDWLFNDNDNAACTNYTGDVTDSSFVTMTANP
jgi:hypothetical protein